MMAMGFALNRRWKRLMTPTERRALPRGANARQSPRGRFPEGFFVPSWQPLHAAVEPCRIGDRPMIPLNPSQQQSILLGFLDLHRRMAELEAAIAQCGNSSLFSQYVGDLSATEMKVVQDHFARLRTTMLSCLQEIGIPLDVRRTSLRWTLQVAITFLNIAVAEMSPERLRGYGALDGAAAKAVIKIQQELHGLIDALKMSLK
jgi:hypothetical protein